MKQKRNCDEWLLFIKTKTWKIMRLYAVFLVFSLAWTVKGYAHSPELNLKTSFSEVIEVLEETEYTNLEKELLTQQQQTVSGIVTDQDGQTLPGVTVMIKGTTQGTTTNANGEYSLSNVPADAILEFRFVGMETQEIVVGDQTEINVTMVTAGIGIDEVVVIGYTTRRVSELTSAISVVQEEDLQGVISSNLGTMLQGKVPGVRVSNTTGRPGQDPQIVVRGVGSIGAGFAPLIVVDGIIGGTYNPQDIETITVLKDAAASGLYGSRAANGVIVITTKSGAAGRTKVSVNSSVGFSYFNEGNLRVMTAQELFDYRRTAATNSYNRLSAPTQTLDEYLEANVPISLLNHQTDWQSLLRRTGAVNKQQFSISGGTDETTFYVSGNYFQEKGTLINMEYEQIDVRANINHKISDIFGLNFRVAMGQSQNPNEPLPGQQGTYFQSIMNMPFDPPFDEDGNPVNPGAPGVSWLGNANSNYFFNREHEYDHTKSFNLSSDVVLDAKIADWVTFRTSNRFGFNHHDRTQVLDQFHQLSSAANGITNTDFSYNNTILTSNTLNFIRQLNDHQLQGILGQEYQYSTSKFSFAEGMDLPIGLSAINATGSPRSVGGNEVEVGFNSYFAQVDYNYQAKYYLLASYRRDASSRFGANNRWGSFYAVGASWFLHRESFMQDIEWIDRMQLKASYGTTGNANITDYLSLDAYGFGLSYAGNAAAAPARLPNPDLTWEVAYTTNLGLEFSVFERVSFGVDWYNRDNKDLLQAVPLSAATGFEVQQQNVGALRNRGWDIFMSTTNLRGEFTWITSVNFNFNKSEVLSLNNAEDIPLGNFMRISEGRPLRSWYMREWAGVDVETGQPLWVRWEDEDGNKIDQIGGDDPTVPANITTVSSQGDASLLFVGSPYPDFIGGIRNDFSYRGFDLSILTDFSYGNTIFSPVRARLDADGAFPPFNKMIPMDGWTRWEEPGDIATHPQLLLGGNNQAQTHSSRYIEDGSFFRIQNISLTYNVGRSLAFFSNVRINVSIDNLVTFTNYSGMDPTMNMENPVVVMSANALDFAPTRKVVFGLGFDL